MSKALKFTAVIQNERRTQPANFYVPAELYASATMNSWCFQTREEVPLPLEALRSRRPEFWEVVSTFFAYGKSVIPALK